MNMFNGSTDSSIKIVQQGYLGNYDTVSVQSVLENYAPGGEWGESELNDGQDYIVEYKQPDTLTLRFKKENGKQDFVVSGMEFVGENISVGLEIKQYLDLIYEEYRKKYPDQGLVIDKSLSNNTLEWNEGPVKSVEDVQEGAWYSIDLEEYAGYTLEQLKKEAPDLHEKKIDSFQEQQWLVYADSQNIVTFSFMDEDCLGLVTVCGNSKNSPSILGIRIGDDKDQVLEKLGDSCEETNDTIGSEKSISFTEESTGNVIDFKYTKETGKIFQMELYPGNIMTYFEGINTGEELYTDVEEIKEDDTIIVLDPAHQQCYFSEEEEPIGPGAKKTKHKYSESDSGTFTGQNEAELCLQVAIKVRDILQNKGYKVFLTREDGDTLVSNVQRSQIASDYEADVYVRINGNSNKSSEKNGATCIIPSIKNTYVGNMYKECKNLAELLLDSYCAVTGMLDNGCDERDDNSGINWSTVPVALLELGYLSNEQDDRNMYQETYRNRMAEGIAEGIERYLSGDYLEQGDYLISDSDSRILEDYEIAALSDNEKQMAINEIYARHGLKFQTQVIQEYFEKQGWYTGSIEPGNFDDKLLNEFERTNIEKLAATMESGRNSVNYSGSYIDGTGEGSTHLIINQHGDTISYRMYDNISGELNCEEYDLKIQDDGTVAGFWNFWFEGNTLIVHSGVGGSQARHEYYRVGEPSKSF